MPVFFSFALVREDLARHVTGITVEQVWQPRAGGPLGFHLKHLPGSVDRLVAYLFERQLSAEELKALSQEATGHESATELLARLDQRLTAAEQALQTLDPDAIFQPRTVGRSRLPTTVLGLLVHLAEHTQRHLGQIITICHWLRAQA